MLGNGQARRDDQRGRSLQAQQGSSLLQRGQLVEHPLGVRREELAGGGEHGPAPAALDQLDPEPPFQRAHPLAGRRLADVHLRRRSAEAAPQADEDEQP